MLRRIDKLVSQIVFLAALVLSWTVIVAVGVVLALTTGDDDASPSGQTLVAAEATATPQPTARSAIASPMPTLPVITASPLAAVAAATAPATQTVLTSTPTAQPTTTLLNGDDDTGEAETPSPTATVAASPTPIRPTATPTMIPTTVPDWRVIPGAPSPTPSPTKTPPAGWR